MTAVALTLLGLVGLSVSAGGLVGGPALWPSFSGEHVYTAHLSTAYSDAHTPHIETYAPPRRPASDALALRVINESARGVCQSEAGARRQAARVEPVRRQRRQRTPARRTLTLLIANASGRLANS